MISTVSFYSMPGSLSSGEYPLLENGQDLSDYLVHQTEAKHSKDILQSITVPEFSGQESVNLIEADGLWYWVASFQQSTIYNDSLTFGLKLNAPTSFLKKGDSITGSFKRTPTWVSRFMQQDISSAPLIPSRDVSLDLDMPTNASVPSGPGGQPDKVFWVQISIRDKGVFGWPAPFYVRDPFNSGNILCDSQNSRIYPPLPSGMGIAELFNSTDDDIMDLSITSVCPFNVSGGSSYTVDAGTLVQPSSAAMYNAYRVYKVSKDPIEITRSYTITDDEKLVGRSTIYGAGGNAITNILHETSRMVNDDNALSLVIRPYYDDQGLYTQFNINGVISTVCEGKLPWSNDAWNNYKSLQMNLDREVLVHNNETALKDLIHTHEIQGWEQARDAATSEIQAITAFDIMSLGLRSISTYELNRRNMYFQKMIDMRSSAYTYDMARRQNEWDFEMKQKQAYAQMNSINNLGYGLSYCYRHYYNPPCIKVSMPYGVDASAISDFTKNLGYPAQGFHTIQASKGYIQCKLLNDGNLTGVYFDELNSILMDGIKFIEVSSE